MSKIVRTFTGWQVSDIQMSLHIGLLPNRKKPVLYYLDKEEKIVALAVFSDDEAVKIARTLLNKIGEGDSTA
tara:strand:+ start:15373 stop:15588 length:216 start_codon:yes stop_codon:yes gene_type:complete